MKQTPSRRLVPAVSFLLPAAMMAAVFAVCGLVPFGTRTLGVMDMAHQYLPFLYSLRDILRGDASLLYLPSMCLGGNMLGVAAYYLTSPLNLITCLFPRESMYTAISLLYFLRVGLCGLTMGVYTGRRYGYGWRNLVPATGYAFMAFMIGYCFNYLWQDCVILMPLVALGIARIVERRSPWLYILTLGGALLLNFYIGYILCLFSVLFFLYELFSVPRSERVSPWKTLGVFAVSSLAAGALAAVLLVPAAFSLSGGKAEFSLSVLTLAPQFDPVRLLSKLYIGAFDYEEIMPSGLPQIFTGTVTAALAILYFANRRIPRRRRVLTGAFLLILAASFWITALDLTWHALNTPSWYNHRYSFLFSFLVAAAAGRELWALDGTRPRQLWLPIGLVAAASLLTFIGQSYDYVTWRAALAALLMTAAVCACVWAYLRPGTGRRLAVVLAAAVLVVHVGDLAVNAGLSLTALTIPASDSASYAEYVTKKGAAFDAIDTGDAFVRVESTTEFNQDRCEPMLFGYDGITHYGSTLSQESLDFLDRLGADRYTDLWAAYGAGVTEAADTLLGIRYVVSETLPKGYAPTAEANGYTVWENPNALPIGWTADAAIRADIPETDCFSYLNALYAAAAPEVGADVFVPAAVEDIETEALVPAGDGRYALEGGALAGALTYTLRANADGALYMTVDFPDLPSVIVSTNGAFTAYYATAQINGSLYLGDFAAGETVTVKLQAYSDLEILSAAFATEDTAALARYAGALKTGGCALTKLSASHFTGSFTTGAGDGLLVLTIPYDPAWRVTLDGAGVQPEKVQGCLMAVAADAGAHTVELRYIPRGLVPGAVITALAILGCVIVYMLKRKKI